jgi:hypothetical protein
MYWSPGIVLRDVPELRSSAFLDVCGFYLGYALEVYNTAAHCLLIRWKAVAPAATQSPFLMMLVD